MELVTSYYSNQKKLRAAGFKICSVSVGDSRFCPPDVSLKMFAPTRAMLSMDTEDYNREYTKILKKIDIALVRSYIRDLEKRGVDKLALCCHEADHHTCHRKRVGEYLSIKLMTEIKEFGLFESKNPATEQKTMFDH